MQYEGYGKAMYESVVEQTTFLSGQYTDNKEYVKGSINAVKDFAKGWYDETSNTLKECFNLKLDTGLMDCYGAFTEVGGATVLTVGDWIKKFFKGYEDTRPPAEDIDYGSFYSPYLYARDFYLYSVSGYEMVVQVPYTGKTYTTVGITDETQVYGDQYQTAVKFAGNVVITGPVKPGFNDFIFDLSSKPSNSVGGMLARLQAMNVNVYVREVKTGTDIKPGSGDKNLTSIRKYLDDNGAGNVVVPEPKPSLTCPGGEKINLTVDGSTFIGSDGKVMLVNKNGTATVNGTTCALQWQTPQMDYIDDKPAMTDKDGNWIDMVTGDILKCMVTGDCKPSVPGDKEEVEELDPGLIEYVKNAYKYATEVLKTGTDGLKSLATGAKDLTALFGVFFSWLPPEMVVLMSSGLAIAIGLRLFRK